METIVKLTLIAVTPAAVLYGGLSLLVWLWRGEFSFRRGDGPAPAGRSLERMVADLRRLQDEDASLRLSDLPAKAKRLQALTLAYDDTLRECCRMLDLPTPPRSPLGEPLRTQTEVALAARGLRW